MINKMKYQILIVGGLLIACSSNVLGYSEAKLTLKILGEDGLPIARAKVGVTYQLPKGTEQGVNFVTVGGVY
jgi:hypothetical protein